jgi:hypothetical protein
MKNRSVNRFSEVQTAKVQTSTVYRTLSAACVRNATPYSK